ncbi:MAG: UbiA family prenyltransferase, partial [Candidatus Ranarchaeia archaeon]
MVLSQIKAVLRLTRFEISIVSALAVFVAGILAGDLHVFKIEYILGFLIVFTTSSGAFALNDYLDYDLDLQNNRTDRPLTQNLLSKRSALIIAILGFVSTQVLAFFLGPLPHFLVVIGAPFFFFYSLGLKKILILKNIIIAGAYSGTVVFSSVLVDSTVEPLISYFALMGFIVG